MTLDLRDTLGPLRDQGERPTCLAHATTSAHEHRRAPSTVALSPEYLHHFASNASSSVTGVSITSVRAALHREGQTSESDCPYWITPPPQQWFPAANLTVYRRHSKPIAASLLGLETAMQAGLTPVIGIALPDSFFAPQAPWVVTAGVTIHGLHAVLAVALGRSATGTLVKIRNSWGDGWAENGHAWLDEPFLMTHLLDAMVLQDEA